MAPQHYESLAAEVAVVREVVERLERTLLGNHQPGRCAINEERIATLERWRSRITGALAVIGVIYTGIVAVLGAVLAAKLRQGG